MSFTRLIFCLAFLTLSASAGAAEFCISAGDTASLSSALATSATNGEDDFIYLEPGTYPLDAGTPKLSYYATVPENLTIEGGYTPFFGGGCGKLTQYGADATVIDGGDSGTLGLMSNSGGLITLKFLKIQNMITTGPNAGSPVGLGDGNNGNVSIDLENVIFENNVSTSYYPIDIGSNQTIIRNSVLAKNQTFAGYPQIHVDAKSGGFCAVILNSTITDNVGGYYALEVDAAPDCTPLIANSIFWGNTSGDLFLSVSNQSSVYFSNNDIRTFSSDSGVPINGLDSVVAVDPLFVDASSGNYALQDASLLHDHGSGLAFLGGPGIFDVSALPRTYGPNPDIGAYEIQDVIFANGFDQPFPFQ